jgi:MFS family permease
VLVALVPTFFGQPYMAMLAVFAHDVLAIGPTGLGLLTACAALGSIVGALLAGSLRKMATRGIAMLLFMITFGALLAAFAYSTWPLVSAVLIVGVGAMHMAYNASNNTILQMSVPDEYRGRVLSTLFLNRGLVSLGTTATVTLAALVGPSLAVASMGAIILLIGIGVMILAPTFRHLNV